MALLETRDLSKSFGGLQAIDKVSLKVEPNTIHGLIGPNGSGKSTFFNLLTGVYQPDEGSHISFDGVDITISPAHTIAGLGLARTFQLLRLYGELSVLDNVMVGYHPHTKYGPLAPLSTVLRCGARTRPSVTRCRNFLSLLALQTMPKFQPQNCPVVSAVCWHSDAPSRCVRKCCFSMNREQGFRLPMSTV